MTITQNQLNKVDNEKIVYLPKIGKKKKYIFTLKTLYFSMRSSNLSRG